MAIVDIDLDYRPQTYWAPPGVPTCTIKGENRRRLVEQLRQQGRIDEIAAWMLLHNLPPAILRRWVDLDPHNVGGELLPNCRQDEVEIARVIYRSKIQDVVSIRASRDSDGAVDYRIVDESGQRYIYLGELPRQPDQPTSPGG